MKYFISVLLVLISSAYVFGHNPLSAKYHLEAGEKVSLLIINLSQAGVNQALLKKYSESELAAKTQNEFKALVVNYIKNNFILSFGEREIHLKEGGVKLGDHQTDLKFVLPPIANSVEEMVIDIPAFQENDNHQTIFSYQANGKSDYMILSSKNDYQATARFSEPTKTKSSSVIWLVMAVISSLLIILKKLEFSNETSILLSQKVEIQDLFIRE